MNCGFLRGVFATIISVSLFITVGCSSEAPKVDNTTEEQTTTKFVVKDNKRYLDNIFSKVDVDKDLLYSEATNNQGVKEKLLLDVFTPAGDSERNRPAIIWIHGGGFTGGNKDGGIERDFAIEFAKKGYVTVNINYRLRENPGADWNGTFMDSTTDAATAVNWLVSNAVKYGVDKNNIAIGGYSAGGAIVENLTYSDRGHVSWQKDSIFAAINIAGGELWMGTPKKGDPASLIIHGTEDTTVAFSQSEVVAGKLKSGDVDYTFYPLQGISHDISVSYDEMIDVMTKFLYKQLTGIDLDMKIRKGSTLENDKLKERRLSSNVYKAKQVDIKVDGKLEEWGNSTVMDLNKTKDAGSGLPDKNDFSGTAMVGWNEKDPTRIYFAASVIDDSLQDINPNDNNWWMDDSLEFILDLTEGDIALPCLQWAISANGADLSALSTKENTEWKVARNGKKYIYEAAIDLTKGNDAIPEYAKTFKVQPQKSIGFTLHINDCENNNREHQLGWTTGGAWDRRCFGNLIFDSEKAK